MLAPLAYSATVLIITLAYIRRKYTEADPGRCVGCPLQGFCSKLRLNMVLPPGKLVRRPSKDSVIKACSAIVFGYAITLSAALLALGLNTLADVLAPILASGSLAGFTVRVLLALPSHRPH